MQVEVRLRKFMACDKSQTKLVGGSRLGIFQHYFITRCVSVGVFNAGREEREYCGKLIPHNNNNDGQGTATC